MSGQAAADEDFEAAWRRADRVGGWLHRAQGLALYRAAAEISPGGLVVEIGSHQGRSTLILASQPVRVIAVDPFVGGRYGGAATRETLERNLEAAGVRERVTIEMTTSGRLQPTWDQPIDLLFIDGKHDYWTVCDDLRWADHLPEGGTVLLHDCFSSVGVTTAVLRGILPGRSLAYVGRVGSLAEFHRQHPTRAQRLAIVKELPWWVGNVGLKVLLRLRLRRVAGWFGHHDTADPY